MSNLSWLETGPTNNSKSYLLHHKGPSMVAFLSTRPTASTKTHVQYTINVPNFFLFPPWLFSAASRSHATARSKGPPRAGNTPDQGHAARWSPMASLARRQRRVAAVSGTGNSSRRNMRTRKSDESRQSSDSWVDCLGRNTLPSACGIAAGLLISVLRGATWEHRGRLRPVRRGHRAGSSVQGAGLRRRAWQRALQQMQGHGSISFFEHPPCLAWPEAPWSLDTLR